MSPAQRRYVAIEAAVGAAINGVLSFAFCLLIFGGSAQVPVYGLHGLIADAVPQSFMVAFMSMLVPTLLTRARLRKGQVLPLPGPPARGLRHPIPLAVLVAAIVAAASLAVQMAALPMGPPLWAFKAALLVKTLYGALLGAALTGVAVRIALRDNPSPRR